MYEIWIPILIVERLNSLPSSKLQQGLVSPSYDWTICYEFNSLEHRKHTYKYTHKEHIDQQGVLLYLLT